MTREPAGEIAERFLIHLSASAGAVLATFTVLRALARVTSWLPSERLPLLLVSALTVFAVSALREARDVARGQSLTKVIWDYASLALACALSLSPIQQTAFHSIAATIDWFVAPSVRRPRDAVLPCASPAHGRALEQASHRPS